MDLSICIPTYRGAFRLARLLATLPSNLDAELLVCDDGSPEPDAQDIADVVAASPLPSRVLSGSGNRGAVAALRDLTQAATGRKILQLDDDVIIPEGFFEVMDVLLGLPNVGVLSWRACGMVTGHLEPGQSELPRLGFVEPATELAGYCMAYRRSVLEEVGGIDTRYKMYCSDSDFTLRVMLAGHPCYRVWWPLVPHEEHGVYKDPDNATLRLTRDRVTPEDAAAFLSKWGAMGPEMESRALARLRR
jgi:GT2 family glycosyltransferase